MTKRLFVAAAIAAFATVPAHAVGPVTVTLDVSLGDDVADYAVCDVAVPAGSDGFVVLDAAIASGCIDSYDAIDFGGAYGRFLTCIDGICGQDAPTWALPVPVAYAGTTWNFTIDDAFASVGLETYEVHAGDEVGLTYAPYAFPA